MGLNHIDFPEQCKMLLKNIGDYCIRDTHTMAISIPSHIHIGMFDRIYLRMQIIDISSQPINPYAI